MESLLRLDRSARILLALGLLVTLGTGAGLYLAPVSVGRSFAWPIKAPLTASLMGGGYLAGAALGLALGVLVAAATPRVLRLRVGPTRLESAGHASSAS